MKESNWAAFEWDTGMVQVVDRPKLPPFVFRRATSADRETVEKVFRSVFSQEPAIPNKQNSPMPTIEEACDTAFSGGACACVVVQHGNRIIGASAVNPSEHAPIHLLTGPCILNEYRSRGIGSALLFASLDFLKDSGLTRVIGYARHQSVAARFVYPKFGGKQSVAVSAEDTTIETAVD